MTNFYQVIKKFHLAIITIICSLMHNDVLLAEQESRWEIGIGSVAAETPQYFGSNHYYRGILPYPVLIYRSERVAAQTVDPDKYGQIFVFDNENLLIELDFSGRFPVISSDNDSTVPNGANDENTQIFQDKNYTRRGMPDLPLAGFAGLKISWTPVSFLLIEIPVLKGFTIGSGFKNVGLIFSPTLEVRFLGKQRKNAINITTIYTHGDENYNNFYYGVKEEYKLQDRPKYVAKSGLTTVTYGLTFTWTTNPDLKIVGGYVYHDLHSSVVSDSPLVIAKRNRSIGFAINYTFSRSQNKVEVW